MSVHLPLLIKAKEGNAGCRGFQGQISVAPTIHDPAKTCKNTVNNGYNTNRDIQGSEINVFNWGWKKVLLGSKWHKWFPKVKCMELPHLLCPQVYYNKLETPPSQRKPSIRIRTKMPQRLLFRKSALIPHLPSRHTVRIPRLANSLARSFMVALRLSFNGRKLIIRRNMKQQTELSWIAPWSKTHTGPSGNALVHSLASSSPNWITHHIWFLSLYTLAFPGVSKPKHLFKCMNIYISFDIWSMLW